MSRSSLISETGRRALILDALGFRVKCVIGIECSGAPAVPIDLVYPELGGSVVELFSYDGVAVDPAPQREHLGDRMIALEVEDMQQVTDYLKQKGNRNRLGPENCRILCAGRDCDPNGSPYRVRQRFR